MQAVIEYWEPQGVVGLSEVGAYAAAAYIYKGLCVYPLIE